MQLLLLPSQYCAQRCSVQQINRDRRVLIVLSLLLTDQEQLDEKGGNEKLCLLIFLHLSSCITPKSPNQKLLLLTLMKFTSYPCRREICQLLPMYSGAKSVVVFVYTQQAFLLLWPDEITVLFNPVIGGNGQIDLGLTCQRAGKL